MKKEWIPVSGHWDDIIGGYSDDIIRLLGCIVETTGMTSTILSLQRVTLEPTTLSFQRVTLESRKKEWIPVSAARMTL
ncbi:WPE palindromic element domain-containing protein [Wolbachia endosymbiont of Ctenocephalides felis wCfeJ]|uniref:WPE palindromic element domain-containing protein n=1 Tax=Wolbachia endosymbiont of Ctenocephalides felis wCfeJ TaxID=2732594 RepID=UPI0014476904|nr:WPE palindromic element domain-containing protein [Wolbachia endosymbiont of Ctenocephalides felis wCfeJ]